jgi:putative phosphoribosyl transferase
MAELTFANRVAAGRELAASLAGLADQDVVVLGLPRGGVPVAAQIADAIGAPLDVIVVRKLGVPFQPELGMGAIGEAGALVLSAEVIASAGISERELAQVRASEQAELDRRARRFRGSLPPLPLDGKIAVIVDDGVATGSTARAACQIARARGAARVLLAVPVAPPGFAARIGPDADEFVCLRTPTPFYSIGQFYADFRPTGDEEVIDWLSRDRARHRGNDGAPPGDDGAPPGDDGAPPPA